MSEVDEYADYTETQNARTFRTVTKKQDPRKDVSPSRNLNYLTEEQLERNDNLAMGRTYFDRLSSGAPRRYGSTFMYDKAQDQLFNAVATGQIDQNVFDSLCIELAKKQTRLVALNEFYRELVKRFKKP